MLATPTSVDEIYVARGDVAPHRPLLQGDVFDGIVIPGVEIEHDRALVATHPCTMRKGAVIVERVKALPVTPYQEVDLDRWADSHYRVFPLPQLVDGQHYAARFDEIGMVRTSDLTLSRRVATLSDQGILMFQQRQIFADTRAVLPLDRLQQVSAAVLAEVELLEEWNERLVGEGGPEELETEARAFDELLSASPDGLALRAMLGDPARRSHVRKVVRGEIRNREEAARGI
jgi:hypothetical protein